MDFQVTITGLDELIANCKAAGANAQPMMDAATVKAAAVVQADIRTEAPHRTGALQRSILTENMDSAVMVSANVKYAIYVEMGTSPHQILPVNKKALFWKGALNPYASVMNPGMKANPFFKRGIDVSKDEVLNVFSTVRDNIIKQLAEGR